MTERACRVCGCTETRGCPGGCAWVEGEDDLCTACLEEAQALLRVGGPRPFMKRLVMMIHCVRGSAR